MMPNISNNHTDIKVRPGKDPCWRCYVVEPVATVTDQIISFFSNMAGVWDYVHTIYILNFIAPMVLAGQPKML